MVISGDGTHVLYGASVNSFGDKELPITVTFKLDTTPPTVTCVGKPPSFRFGDRHAVIAATVADAISGPASPIVNSRVDTSTVGLQNATLAGSDVAGLTSYATCPFTVLPPALKPTPKLGWTLAVTHLFTDVRQLYVLDVAPGAAVTVACHGKGCPFSSRTIAAADRSRAALCTGSPRGRPRRVELTRLFAGRHLSVGTQLSVRITKPQTIGRIWQFTTRSGRDASYRTGCLPPGSLVLREHC
jgi:hypothetical protein